MNFNSIGVIDNIIYVSDIHSDSLFFFNVDGDSIAKKAKTDTCEQHRFIWEYKSAQIFILDSLKGETSTYYPITPKDSSIITGLKLESYRQKIRGVNNEYALCFKDAKGREYKLMFPTDDNKGAITIYDVVPYDATRLVISFWYYERFGVSNTQLGVLDLSQFIKE